MGYDCWWPAGRTETLDKEVLPRRRVRSPKRRAQAWEGRALSWGPAGWTGAPYAEAGRHFARTYQADRGNSVAAGNDVRIGAIDVDKVVRSTRNREFHRPLESTSPLQGATHRSAGAVDVRVVVTPPQLCITEQQVREVVTRRKINFASFLSLQRSWSELACLWQKPPDAFRISAKTEWHSQKCQCPLACLWSWRRRIHHDLVVFHKVHKTPAETREVRELPAKTDCSPCNPEGKLAYLLYKGARIPCDVNPDGTFYVDTNRLSVSGRPYSEARMRSKMPSRMPGTLKSIGAAVRSKGDSMERREFLRAGAGSMLLGAEAFDVASASPLLAPLIVQVGRTMVGIIVTEVILGVERTALISPPSSRSRFGELDDALRIRLQKWRSPLGCPQYGGCGSGSMQMETGGCRVMRRGIDGDIYVPGPLFWAATRASKGTVGCLDTICGLPQGPWETRSMGGYQLFAAVRAGTAHSSSPSMIR